MEIMPRLFFLLFETELKMILICLYLLFPITVVLIFHYLPDIFELMVLAKDFTEPSLDSLSKVE